MCAPGSRGLFEGVIFFTKVLLNSTKKRNLWRMHCAHRSLALRNLLICLRHTTGLCECNLKAQPFFLHVPMRDIACSAVLPLSNNHPLAIVEWSWHIHFPLDIHCSNISGNSTTGCRWIYALNTICFMEDESFSGTFEASTLCVAILLSGIGISNPLLLLHSSPISTITLFFAVKSSCLLRRLHIIAWFCMCWATSFYKTILGKPICLPMLWGCPLQNIPSSSLSFFNVANLFSCSWFFEVLVIKKTGIASEHF